MAMYGVSNCADYVFSAKIINEGNLYIFFPCIFFPEIRDMFV